MGLPSRLKGEPGKKASVPAQRAPAQADVVPGLCGGPDVSLVSPGIFSLKGEIKQVHDTLQKRVGNHIPGGEYCLARTLETEMSQGASWLAGRAGVVVFVWPGSQGTGKDVTGGDGAGRARQAKRTAEMKELVSRKV